MRSARRRCLAASWLAAGAAALTCLPQGVCAAAAAATPPMGWNSYDSYGTTLSEAQFRARPDSAKGWYLAAFNMQPRRRTLTLSWPALALPPGRYEIHDLWQHRDESAAALTVHPDGHGTALYRLQPR